MNDLIRDEFVHYTERFLNEAAKEALMEHDTNLESRIDDLESQASDHEDRIDVLDGAFADVEEHGDRLDNIELFEERIEKLENQLRQVTDLNKLVEQKVEEMISQNRLKLYVASPPPQ